MRQIVIEHSSCYGRYISPAVAIELFIKGVSVRDNVVIVHKDHDHDTNSDILFTADGSLYTDKELMYLSILDPNESSERETIVKILCGVSEEWYRNVHVPAGCVIVSATV